MRTQEEWKSVVDYEGFYEVSDLGRVKSLPRNTTKGGILKPSNTAYSNVTLYKNGEKGNPVGVHTLVWEAFKGKVPYGKEIDHLDGNPKNNRLSNLDVKTHKENIHNPITEKRQKEAAKKRVQDPKWRKNQAEAMERRSQNQEWRKNVADANRRLVKDPEWRRKTASAVRKSNSKPVDQYTLDGIFVKTWSSATDAARGLGLEQSCISACCNGKQKTAYGYIWKKARLDNQHAPINQED